MIKFIQNVILGLSVCLLALAFYWPAQAQTPSTNLPSIDQFFDFKTIYSPQLSPNGETIAILRDQGEKRFLILINTKDNAVSKLDLADIEPIKIQWATNERLLVAVLMEQDIRLANGWRIRDDEGRVTRTVKDIPMVRMIAMNKDGSDPVLLFKDADKKVNGLRWHFKVTSVLPNDPDHVLMPINLRRLSLYKVNIHTGAAKEVHRDKHNTTGYRVNQNGYPIVRFDSSGGGRHVKVYVRAAGEKKWDRIAKIREEEFELFQNIAPSHDPKVYYVTARPNGADKYGIYRYDAVAKKFLDAVSTHDAVDITSALLDETGRYVGVRYYENRLTYDFNDKTLDTHYAAIEGFFNDRENISLRQISGDGKIWLLYVDGPQNPGGFFYYDTQRRHIEPIVHLAERLPETALGRTEFVSYQTRDGQTLGGMMTQPSVRSGVGSNAPLIIMPHGGPEARDYYGFDPTVQFLASRGYRVYQPNFRGSSGYGKAFAEAGYGQWGGLMQDDITDATNHLIKTGQAQADKICIAGISYGGYAALMGAVKTPDLFACAVSINGVSNLIEQADYDINLDGKNSDLADYIEKSIGHPKKDQARLVSTSPTYQAAKIKVPVLIIHGADDTIVPVEQGRLMRDALEALGKPVEYLELEGVDHNLTGGPTPGVGPKDDYYGHKNALRKLEIFLNTHLK